MRMTVLVGAALVAGFVPAALAADMTSTITSQCSVERIREVGGPNFKSVEPVEGQAGAYRIIHDDSITEDDVRQMLAAAQC